MIVEVLLKTIAEVAIPSRFHIQQLRIRSLVVFLEMSS
jgi:hypothetical protein